MPERHYTENEVAEIFKLATDPEQPARSALPPGEGMEMVYPVGTFEGNLFRAIAATGKRGR